MARPKQLENRISLWIDDLMKQELEGIAKTEDRDVSYLIRKGIEVLGEALIKIYREHYPIARHLSSSAGKAEVLYTTKSASVTTYTHCSTVRSAVSHLTLFEVVNIVPKNKAEPGGNLADYA